MKENIKRLNLNGKEIILLGTAHVSQDSIDEANTLIEEEKPDRVGIELDDGRYENLKNPENWRNIDISKVLKEKRGWVLLANLALGSFQKRMGAGVGVKPGDELKAAADKAESLNIPIELIDRPIQTTLRRAWAKNSFWGKCKLLSVLVSAIFDKEEISSEEVENLKNSSEMDQMMGELADYLPGVKTVLIDERDQYLASKIWQSFDHGGNKILAVVGAGHLPGIVRHLNSFAAGESAPSIEEISIVPPPGKLSKILAWAIPVAILSLIVAGFFKGGAQTSAEMLLNWWLVNGVLAAIGAVLALAHPLTIFISFMGACVTAINPFIGIGIVAGLVQAWVSKPKVNDMENLMNDAASLKGFYRNRILKVLLVFFLVSIGGSIGTFAAIPSLISVF
ncbi:MAG: TraB/GumN family protein [Treponemataceae bacterium]|nr:TraB/GumN family protein [Treponemataceae bacterium]